MASPPPSVFTCACACAMAMVPPMRAAKIIQTGFMASPPFLIGSTQGPEGGSDLFGEELRLFPRREVAALVHAVVIDELGISALRPAPRSFILLAREDGDGHGNGDTLGVEEAAPVFPIEAGCGDPRVRQPIERDVVEDLVTRQLARGAGGPGERREHRGGGLAVRVVVVEKPGGQADG